MTVRCCEVLLAAGCVSREVKIRWFLDPELVFGFCLKSSHFGDQECAR